MQDEGEVSVLAPCFSASLTVEIPAQIRIHATVICSEPLYQPIHVGHDVVVADVAVYGEFVAGLLELAERVELVRICGFGHTGSIGLA
jgi:hypothetical protein